MENRDLWEALEFASRGRFIKWEYVEGHAGYPGNERCDEIATQFADKADIALYHGTINAYAIDLDAEPAVQPIKQKTKSSSGIKAYSYLSLVDGILMKHKTWAECEARVKGVRGAKFKKAISEQNEENIIKEWGL